MNLNSVMIGSENPAALIDYYTHVFGEPAWSDGGFTGWQLGTGGPLDIERTRHQENSGHQGRERSCWPD